MAGEDKVFQPGEIWVQTLVLCFVESRELATLGKTCFDVFHRLSDTNCFSSEGQPTLKSLGSRGYYSPEIERNLTAVVWV